MSKSTTATKSTSSKSNKEAVATAKAAPKKAQPKKAAPAVQLAIGQGHRNSEEELEAMTIHKLADSNPRREGAIGWHSWNVIKKGMTVAEYIDAGGRMKDLRWDIAKGYIEVR